LYGDKLHSGKLAASGYRNAVGCIYIYSVQIQNHVASGNGYRWSCKSSRQNWIDVWGQIIVSRRTNGGGKTLDFRSCFSLRNVNGMNRTCENAGGKQQGKFFHVFFPKWFGVCSVLRDTVVLVKRKIMQCAALMSLPFTQGNEGESFKETEKSLSCHWQGLEPDQGLCPIGVNLDRQQHGQSN
jgi:hypothetical protein